MLIATQRFLAAAVLLVSWMCLLAQASPAHAAPRPANRPNVIFILADDLAQNDLGSYGQKLIKTPRLDQFAAQGVRFTQAYTGAPVCAPSRASLMTGLHMGHCPVRANRETKPEGQFPLPQGTYSVAQLFKSAGYATACTGKWGLGLFDTTGSPLKLGFDHFFGYNCQRHAHSYFPTYLYRNDQRFELDGKTYAQNLIMDDTLAWVREHKDQPFFLYFAVTLPHGKYEIDSQGEYASRDWPEMEKTYAAMVSRLDSDVGRLMDLLKELKLDEQTLVILSGDNGSQLYPDSPAYARFYPEPRLRGIKRSMYEGGLRQPSLARWPGKIPAGVVSDEPWAFWDFLPTMAALLEVPLPEGVKTDGLNVLPVLQGGKGAQRECFYWELHEGTSNQAVRFGNWKAVRNAPGKPLELYDLASDVGEKNNVADKHPELIQKAEALMVKNHVDDPNWPMATRQPPAKKKAKQP